MGIYSCTIEKVDFEENAFKVLKCPLGSYHHEFSAGNG